MSEFIVAILSSFKFAMTFPIAIVEFGFGFFKTILWTNIGGIAGIFFFMYLSKRLIRFWSRNIRVLFKTPEKTGKTKKRLFSKRTRRIVSIKKKYGLPGIAAITPFLLSIPVGVFIVARYFKTSKSKIIWLFASNIFWSFIYAAFYMFFYELYRFLLD